MEPEETKLDQKIDENRLPRPQERPRNDPTSLKLRGASDSNSANEANNASASRYSDILKRAGLSDREATVYEFLLENGQCGIANIQKHVPYNRTNLYDIVYSLRDKGLIEQTIKKGKIEFKPRDPNELNRFVVDQKNRYNEAESLLTSVMPALSEMFKMTTEKPVVRVYEGYEGIKAIYEDTLRENKSILSFLGLYESDPKILKWLENDYVKRRIANNIKARVIVSSDQKNIITSEYLERDRKELRETKVIDNSEFPAKLEIQIYGNKVAFANHNKNNALVGVIIDNKFIAETMKGLFELAWASAK